jgi:hypothetical protein
VFTLYINVLSYFVYFVHFIQVFWWYFYLFTLPIDVTWYPVVISGSWEQMMYLIGWDHVGLLFTKTPVHSGQSKKIYESIIKTPAHSGQGTCTESITMQFPRFKNKPRVILFFYNQSVTMLWRTYSWSFMTDIFW